MFGLSKQERRWKAEQRAAETIVELLGHVAQIAASVQAVDASRTSDLQSNCDNKDAKIADLHKRITELEKALPTCDEHKPRGGARATCIICACEKLSGALSQISYLCGPPNELEVSEYDTHYDEQLVVEQVRKRIAELEAFLLKYHDCNPDDLDEQGEFGKLIAAATKKEGK